MNKNLYIISGCNGAGKTTASYTVLPEILDCKEFVNADCKIASGGRNANTIIDEEMLYSKMQSYVK